VGKHGRRAYTTIDAEGSIAMPIKPTDPNGLQTSVSYLDAQTRGLIRLWKTQLAERCAIADRVHENKQAIFPVVSDMVWGSRTTRQRAFNKLTALLGPGVRSESVDITKRGGVTVWSILVPRGSVVDMDKLVASEGRRGSLAQNCVAVNFIVAGKAGRSITVCEGLWSMEIPDHALGRLLERSRLPNPEAVIREAHRNLLELPSAVATERLRYIKAGPRCFVGRLMKAEDVEARATAYFFRVGTWLENSMLGEDQVPLRAKGEPGDRLGDTYLVPWPFRR
jgi:hypothetical protein